MQFQNVFPEFCQSLGLDGEDFKNTDYSILIDNEHEVSFVVDVQADLVNMVGVLCKNEGLNDTVYKELLCIAATQLGQGGAYFALDIQSHNLLLCRHYANEFSDMQNFADCLNEFMGQIVYFKQNLPKIAQETAKVDDELYPLEGRDFLLG